MSSFFVVVVYYPIGSVSDNEPIPVHCYLDSAIAITKNDLLMEVVSLQLQTIGT